MDRKIYQISVDNEKTVKVGFYHLEPDGKRVLDKNCEGQLQYKKYKQRISDLHKLAAEGCLEEENARELGRFLYSSLFDQNLSGTLEKIFQEANKAAVRIEIDVNQIVLPELAALPWEFIEIPYSLYKTTNFRSLSVYAKLSFVRKCRPQPTGLNIKPIPTGQPLKIALAVAAPKHDEQGDLGPVSFDETWKALNSLAQSFPGRFELLEPVKEATFSKIDRLLEKKPDIFHFIGHARLQDIKGKDVGQAALADKYIGEQVAEWVSSEWFARCFEHHSPSVVILQACESGALSTKIPFVGLASDILNYNVPAVIAMQYEVNNNTATLFIKELYQRLFEGKPVDNAVQLARRRLQLEGITFRGRDFATPIIFLADGHADLYEQNWEPPTLEKLNYESTCFNESQMQDLYRQLDKLHHLQPILRSIYGGINIPYYDHDLYNSSLHHMVYNLANLTNSKHLLNFVQHLATSIEPYCETELTKWLDSVRQKSSSQSSQISHFDSTTSIKTNHSEPPGLIIHLDRRLTTKKWTLLQAWLFDDHFDDNIDDNKLRKLDLSSFPSSSVSEGELRGLLASLIVEANKSVKDPTRLRLEFMLPQNLIDYPVEDWIPKGLRDDKIGDRYPVSVRSVERRKPEVWNMVKPFWEKKWKTLTSTTCNNSLCCFFQPIWQQELKTNSFFCSKEPYACGIHNLQYDDVNELKRLLKLKGEEIACIGLSGVDTEKPFSTNESILRVALENGIVAIIWSRAGIANPQEKEQIENYISNKPLRLLPEIAKDLRNYKIRVGLIWEDYKRTPLPINLIEPTQPKGHDNVY